MIGERVLRFRSASDHGKAEDATQEGSLRGFGLRAGVAEKVDGSVHGSVDLQFTVDINIQ